MRRIPAVSLAALFFAAPLLTASTFTVINTNDSGVGSLRQAILDANANAGADTIAFAIPGPGVHTISPTSALPTMTEAVVLDGYTQPGASPNTQPNGDDAVLLIEIDGSNTGSATKGIVLDGDNCTVRGLVVNRFGSTGIEIHGNGNTVEGNFVGTNPAGTAALPNGNGGIVVGVFGTHSNDTIGGTTPAARNLVSGNVGPGIVIEGTGNVVAGNFIGTDATGTSALGNSDRGVFVNNTGNSVGGPTVASRNVISGNNRGIQFNGSNHFLQGNYIGTDVTGTFAIANVNEGVNVNGATGVLVGGIAAVPGTPPGNVISGNLGVGLDLFADSSGIQVQGNTIGADASGANLLGNSLSGVLVNGHDNFVGGVAAGAGNLIAFNGTDMKLLGSGVEVENNASFVANAIRGNSIFGNARLGIDLRAAADGTGGVTPNDPGDADTGANGLQNFPIITSAVPVLPSSGTHVVGTLRSTPSTTFDLDFYSNPACLAHPHDFLQGQTYLGSTQVTTDGSGVSPIDVTLAPTIQPGERVSATATDPSGNTSEFSQRMPFSITPISGASSGGAALTIAGTDFLSGAAVTIGGVAATGVDVSSYDQITATAPPLPAGSLNDVTVTDPDGTSGTLEKGFVADFLDVPPSQQFYSYVITLVTNAITVGVGGGNYGVDQSTLRQQMAVFLLKARHGLCYAPPPCTGVFPDVPCPSTFADWIEALAAEGITGGCGGGNYCPTNPVLRQQMAVFLLKAEHGSSYVPPPCTGVFADVPCPSTFANWIEQLAAENITGGCGGGNYCPTNPNTRGQMAVFIVKTFNLQ